MLSTHLRDCGETCFTGQLLISSPQGQCWSLLYVGGHIVGDGQGIHPVRRWRRQVSQYGSKLETDVRLKLTQRSNGEGCDLEQLLRHHDLPPNQITMVIEGSLAEVFFDITQHQAHLHQQELGEISVTRQPGSTPAERSNSDTLVKAEFLWIKAQQQWQDWQSAGLAPYSPNLSLRICFPEQLKQEVSEITYDKLSSLMDGQRTLRDLAVKLGQDVRLLTQSLLSYVQRGVMGFKEIPDLGPRVQSITSASLLPPPAGGPLALTQRPQQPSSLIFCIDDSPFIAKALGEVVLKAGYRFVAVQDSLQAMPALLKHKPDMIFLDLVMPIANGYEVCTQIRRVVRFRKTPIVILTGQDGIFDRVRAKLVGSTDFLAKPVEADKVLQMIEKHLVVPDPVLRSAPSPASNSASFSVG